MPKKIWKEEELRPKILELRRKGMSYREIARQIGCSIFTVSKIISPLENPQSRLKKVAELAAKVEEISKKVEILDSKLQNFKFLEEIGKRLSIIEKKVFELEKELKLLRWSAEDRVEDYRCKHLDEDGFCHLWSWKKMEGFEMKEILVKGRKEFLLNAKKHPLICAACPRYEPSEK